MTSSCQWFPRWALMLKVFISRTSWNFNLEQKSSFNLWVRYFEWNFKSTHWNSTQNISPIQRKTYMYFIQTQKFKRSLSSQWETCNNHWLGTYTKVSLPIFAMVNWMIGNISFIPWSIGWLGNISFIWVNSFPPSAAYMHQWTDSSLVQVMACCLIGAKPLPEPMLAYCQLDTWEQIGIRMLPFSFKKIHLKMSSAKMSAILSRRRSVKWTRDSWLLCPSNHPRHISHVRWSGKSHDNIANVISQDGLPSNTI